MAVKIIFYISFSIYFIIFLYILFSIFDNEYVKVDDKIKQMIIL